MLIESQAFNAYRIRPRITPQSQANEKPATDRFFTGADSSNNIAQDSVNISEKAIAKPAQSSEPVRLNKNSPVEEKSKPGSTTSSLNAYVRPDAFSGESDATQHIGVVLDILA